MLLPVNWLKDYVEIDVEAKELADKLTLTGSNVESIKALDREIKNIVVGKILEIKAHEDADKLVVCQVDLGEEVVQIVTGAQNMKEEDYVVVAKVGAVLPGDFKIKETKLRGVDSHGMMCSLEELGYRKEVLTKEHLDGILVLDKEYELGKDALEVLNLDSHVLDIEITPNRTDCLSIIGMAREASAALDKDLQEPEIKINKEDGNISDYIKDVRLESDKCSRYYTRLVKNVKIEDSPLWMQLHLMNAGIKPVNNIVDITNFVMLEYGEPLHAFDLDKISGESIIVRDAKKDEKIVTLDERERELSREDLVIADEEGPLAIAGVMGGLDSEVTEDTREILLEGASFNGKSIRTSSRKFNLRSEASFRFEKEVDPNLCELAVNRACQLIEELGAGEIVAGEIDEYVEKRKERQISLRPKRVNKVLGSDIEVEAMLDYLERLELKPQYKDGKIETTIPTYRRDLELEIDLVEEVGRIYGFHNIENKPLIAAMTQGDKPYFRKVGDQVKFALEGFGYNEVMTYSFISPSSYDKLKIAEDNKLRDYIELINPLGQEYSVMRTTLMPTMLELLSRNYNRKVEEVYAFELGNIFIANELPVKTLPEEKQILSIGFYGEEDFYFLKETVNKTLARLGIKDLRYEKEIEDPSFHPGRTANIYLGDKKIGILGELHPDVADNYDIGKRVYIAQLDFEEIVKETQMEVKFQALPRYPSVARDIAVVVEEAVEVGQIEEIILDHGGKLVEKIELFDIYRGDQIDEGLKSVAISITYRSHESTLKDKRINKIQNLIVKDLEEKLNGELRA